MKTLTGIVVVILVVLLLYAAFKRGPAESTEKDLDYDEDEYDPNATDGRWHWT